MAGFLGTEASLLSDLSLVLTWLFGIVAAVGAVNGLRRRISQHCPLMAAGALLNWIPILVVMIPAWLGEAAETSGMPPTIGALAPLAHGVLGGFTQLLMTYTVIRMYWLDDLPPRRPIWLMRITGILWGATLIGGAVVYLSLYVG